MLFVIGKSASPSHSSDQCVIIGDPEGMNIFSSLIRVDFLKSRGLSFEIRDFSMAWILIVSTILIGLHFPSAGHAQGLDEPRKSQQPHPWDRYNLSPVSRQLRPSAIYATHGSVANAAGVLTGGVTHLSGKGSYVVLDFGKEVGGIVGIDFIKTSHGTQNVALAFSESSLYVGPSSDQSMREGHVDGQSSFEVNGITHYVVPEDHLRGGFRYLTVVLNTSGSVDFNSVNLRFSADPSRTNLRDYPGYFYSNDELLNRIW